MATMDLLSLVILAVMTIARVAVPVAILFVLGALLARLEPAAS